MVSPGLMAEIRANLRTWEQNSLWMYLDSAGLVTVGCGIMLANPATASTIPFFHEKTSAPASIKEISDAWTLLQRGAETQYAASAKAKYSAEHYRKITDLRISDAEASRLRDQHILADHEELKKIYINFDKLPENAQLALFDMIYNLGPGRNKSRSHRASGLRSYLQMNAAISKQNWSAAAANSGRQGVSMGRNHMVMNLFESCKMKRDRFLLPAKL